MGSKKEILSRIGMASKGIVYLLIGILTALAAFGKGGNKTSSKGALKFLAEQPYGKVLLLIIGIGLAGYLFYRLYQAFANLKNHENNFKGYIMRGSYIISGLVYGFLSFTAFKMMMESSSNNSNWLANILNSDYGNIIAIIIAIAILGKALYEFYSAYSGKFKDEVSHTNISYQAKKVLTKVGKVGFTSRGIVATILAFLFFKASLQNSNSDIDRTDAFNFLQNEFGSIVLALVAIGVAIYGVFMLIKSKYPDINLN
ncbi:DUF1206 domain-containing protein [Confluentibacter flavum]|uniref:DUF1206 domain-containing protein n=1 Tax=Confluentibacter flavum TaxID=1909700 RepID=A0A2N3HF99_9FLAO|nr:DUF1206 domain-containing protein [Confluentibacter flavum]PKQ43564.1 hypothetical protein CSW08_18010 [Confluentibacter flavum]